MLPLSAANNYYEIEQIIIFILKNFVLSNPPIHHDWICKNDAKKNLLRFLVEYLSLLPSNRKLRHIFESTKGKPVRKAITTYSKCQLLCLHATKCSPTHQNTFQHCSLTPSAHVALHSNHSAYVFSTQRANKER